MFQLSPEKAIAGIFIKNVLDESPAGRSGQLKTGDRILQVSAQVVFGWMVFTLDLHGNWMSQYKSFKPQKTMFCAMSVNLTWIKSIFNEVNKYLFHWQQNNSVFRVVNRTWKYWAKTNAQHGMKISLISLYILYFISYMCVNIVGEWYCTWTSIPRLRCRSY